MAKICLGCCEIVTGSINENYNGMAIHYGQDWYCGPVVEVANNVVEETIKSVKGERAEKDYLLEISAQQSFAADGSADGHSEFCDCPECLFDPSSAVNRRR